MAVKLNTIEHKEIERIPTMIDDIDWIYGGKGDSFEGWGLPANKISFWYGPPGVGKSRALIQVARSASRFGHKLIYFQGEEDLGTFRTWVGNDGKGVPDTFYVDNAFSVRDQIKSIVEVKPKIIIIDSIQQIKEYGQGGPKNIKYIHDEYRKLLRRCDEIGRTMHVIFVIQVNKDEKTIKGASELKHLFDTEVIVDHLNEDDINDGHFKVAIGTKHRYGRTGDQFKAEFKHKETEAECYSDNRLYDQYYADEMGIERSLTWAEQSEIVARKVKEGIEEDRRNGINRKEKCTWDKMKERNPWLKIFD